VIQGDKGTVFQVVSPLARVLVAIHHEEGGVGAILFALVFALLPFWRRLCALRLW
jgi:hypothetical protein